MLKPSFTFDIDLCIKARSASTYGCHIQAHYRYTIQLYGVAVLTHVCHYRYAVETGMSLSGHLLNIGMKLLLVINQTEHILLLVIYSTVNYKSELKA